MADKTFIANDEEKEMARVGIMAQAEVHMVDLSKPTNAAFVEHMIVLRANQFAEARFLQNIIHSAQFNDTVTDD